MCAPVQSVPGNDAGLYTMYQGRGHRSISKVLFGSAGYDGPADFDRSSIVTYFKSTVHLIQKQIDVTLPAIIF